VAARTVESFCALRSIDRGERIFATASQVRVWLLVEYSGLWTHNLLDDSELPAEVKLGLSEALTAIPGSRLLFIKNDLRARAGLSSFLAITRETERALYRFELDDYRELLEVNWPGLASSPPPDTLQRVDDPLYLVCGDGKHDKCCAMFGLPVYRELVRQVGQTVWQSSHLGGDRFAGNVVWLPGGVYYGHVAAEDVQRIVEATARGNIYLERLRGRSCYGFDLQAAEYFARVASGRRELEAFRLANVERSAGTITVQFDEPGQGRSHRVELARDNHALRGLLTCTSPRELDIPQYRLVGYQVAALPPDKT
jgi:hypothetical protein